jgi:hypothetical protein
MYPVLQEITTGQAGLLRTVLRRLDNFYRTTTGTPTRSMHQDYLTNDPDIRQECDILLKSGSASEQQIIRKIVETGSYLHPGETYRHAHSADILLLSYKGILATVNNDWHIVPSLLRHYSQSEPVTEVEPGAGDQQAANAPDNTPPPNLPR